MTNVPHVTVAAIIHHNDRFLLVEEMDGTNVVVNQPAGHVDPGEDIISAVVRETWEETAHRFQPQAFVGVYQWTHPQSGKTYLRFCFCGDVSGHDPAQTLDEDIRQTLWLTRDEIAHAHRPRSPLVIRCIDDYLAGKRYPLELYYTAVAPTLFA